MTEYKTTFIDCGKFVFVNKYFLGSLAEKFNQTEKLPGEVTRREKKQDLKKPNN